MTQPVPEAPTNVQSNNPYTGIDRGMFVLRSTGEFKFARIHSVRTVCQGPSAAVTVLEYKVMQYKTLPTTPQEYMAGTIVNAPDGTQWFDCLGRGSIIDPIMAEYWAINNYLSWYSQEGGKLTQREKDLINAQAKTFTETMGSFLGLDAVELTATYDAVDGQPLSRTSINLSIDYTRDGVAKHIDEPNLPDTAFDAVRVALNILKTA